MGKRVVRRTRLLAAALCLAIGLPGGSAAAAGVRLEVRLVDGASGRAAAWNAKGQLLLPAPTDRAGTPGPEASAAQEVFVPSGGQGEIRIGREVPFVDWLQRYACRAGLADAGAAWEDVEVVFGVEVLAASPAGAVALALTPGLAFTQGRTRRRAVFAAERVRLAFLPGGEARFEAREGLGEIFGRLLAGYDTQRRVRPVALLLRAEPAGGPGGL